MHLDRFKIKLIHTGFELVFVLNDLVCVVLLIMKFAILKVNQCLMIDF